MSPSSSNPDLVARADEAAAVLREASGGRPLPVAIVLGSGLNALVELFGDRTVVPYSRIPNFPTTTVQGHAGNAVIGSINGTSALLLQGRFHYYEGYDLRTITFPMRVLQRLGVQTVILTAATGGVRVDLRPGNLVCLSDHINLIGSNPLRGPADPRLGERFPDMSEVYSKRLRNTAKEEAKRLGVNLVSAVYACLPGPSYETPAEIRMLRTLGADVVGMSTVPEAIVARQAGMDVLGMALVTNTAAGVGAAPVRHEDVLEAGRKATPVFGKLIRRMVLRLAGVASEGTGSSSGEFPIARQD
ncbi:purine-nucleoside phosphorylase [Planctomyces sp. SH-PL62]|uniref:purine-nucleoside phosphorylase n=1 Tax=Planctomyces sp. SH-PL62 TaxID=1636152 RepID=UPI00078EDCBC|nr:purine-nucleoside phosphorylase [Planctomyces sp. SH-PL62]AMV39637.1 Purine nucleoside phosphorylase 1 [Planctomyces sp. SH-PL62]